MDRIDQLLAEYEESSSTKKDYLDARYFNVVLAGYPGLVTEPVVITITEQETVMTQDDEGKDEVKQIFSAKQVSGSIMTHLLESDPDLIRVIIEKECYKDGEKVKSRHSNLLILDSKAGVAYKFDPLKSHKYTDVVDDLLRKFISPLMTKKGEMYKFEVIDAHPQKVARKLKKHKGMCAAYVIKFACMYVSEMEATFRGYKDIKKFASKVEEMYEEDLINMYGAESEPDIEYGIGGAVGGGLLGGLLLGPVGLVAGALIGGAATGPDYYTPRRVYYY